MIRLVTQFDNPRSRAAVATPTCGCCCCCCCCVASTVAASSYIAMSLREIATRPTAGAQGEAEEQDLALRRAAVWAPIVGCLSIALAAIAGLVLGSVDGTLGVLAFLAAWFALLFWCYRAVRAGSAVGRAVLVVLVWVVAFLIELAVGGSLVVSSAGAYLLLALIVAVAAIVIEYRLIFRRP
jgi:hypothetical protein